ncbi:MAG TPA: alpha/beta fold hydrolase [Caulobacteraceae bacterium]|jgi:pimeloyl-ACP methyl ester carboxylesterase|nr:alpha/beta fold hydrolase [Caulobacteraceae bacterium]
MAEPVVLAPGLLCDAWVWADQRRALKADGHPVFAPDFFGFDSIEAMAAMVLDRAPFPRFALAGHSMGARVAMEVVRQAPGRVLRLALLDTGVHPVRSGEAKARGALVDLARAEGMAAMAARWLPPMVHPDRHGDEGLMAGLLAMVERASPEIFARQQHALLNRPDTEAALAAVRVPTAAIVGRQDAWSPVAQHEAIVAAVPGATLTVIEDSGHMAPVERPEAVTAALRAWLAPPPAPSAMTGF